MLLSMLLTYLVPHISYKAMNFNTCGDTKIRQQADTGGRWFS